MSSTRLINHKKNEYHNNECLPKVLPWKAVLKDKIVKSGVPGSWKTEHYLI